MQRKSPNSSPRHKEQGFKKNAAHGGKPAFKKNFSGPRREDARTGDDRKRDNSGAGHSFDKRKKWEGDKPRRNDDNSGDERRKPGRPGQGRPFENRKKWEDDKPHRKEERAGDADKKYSRSDKERTFDKKKWEGDKPRRRHEHTKDDRGRYNRPGGERTFDRNKKWEGDKPRRADDHPEDAGSRERPGNGRTFDKKKWGGDKPQRRDDSAEDTGKRERSGDRAFDKKKKWEGDKPRRDDSRPFRQREKPFEKKEGAAKPPFGKSATRKKADEKPAFDNLINKAFDPEKKKKDDFSKPQVHEDKVYGSLEEPEKANVPLRPFKAKKKGDVEEKGAYKKNESGRKKRYNDEEEEAEVKEEAMPLNKYIAHSGECSRRDAAELVKQGKVKVNGELVLDPGYKVKPDDQVTLVGKKLKPTKNNVYILLNKPKGYITTNEDPQGRKTVMELVTGAGIDRLFPIGRLDRDTSGLLLITNDGDLTQKLSHPSHEIKKVYQVTLDKPLTKADFEKILGGVELEDGKAMVDALAYLETKNELGLEIHSGRNRIVRRIFESLGYVVEKLDRMMYAGLTKKNLPRGKWRFLDAREIVLLKHFKS